MAHEGAPVQENDAMEVSFPASFKVPNGMTTEQFQLRSQGAAIGGRGDGGSLGKTDSGKVYEWNEVNETGPADGSRLVFTRSSRTIVRQEMLARNGNEVLKN
ncbi:MAG: hypothetical protein U0892_13650 [Pirellulales bacterium]